MNCNEVTLLLSPFHDGELAPEEDRAVAKHIASCAGCAQKLESIRRLADLVVSTPTPDVPGTLLAKIERTLDPGAGFTAGSRLQLRSRRRAAILVATAAIIGSLMVWHFSHDPSHGHHEMVRDFREFLDSYEQGQASTEEVLARKYQGTLVSEAAATSALKRQTVARPIVLASHRVTKRYVLKMPCCDCVQTVYSRNGQTSIVLFEHDKEQVEWFEARPLIRAECRGKACCLVQLKEGLAATWPVDGGFLTVVGVRDVAELGNLVDELHPL